MMRVSSVSGTVIVILVLIALCAPLIGPYDPESMDSSLSLGPPSAAHWLGTDQLGRDVVTRLIWGARISLQISVYAVAFALIVGVAIGVVSSYFGSWIDIILMRIMDVLLTFPALVLAITIAAYLGPSLQNIVFVIGIVYTPVFARLTYVVTRAIKPVEYVQAARALGASHARIIFRAILPNSLAPLIVQVSLSLGFAILTESGLSFLGVGVPPPAPSWGSEIANARLDLEPGPAAGGLALVGGRLRDPELQHPGGCPARRAGPAPPQPLRMWRLPSRRGVGVSAHVTVTNV